MTPDLPVSDPALPSASRPIARLGRGSLLWLLGALVLLLLGVLGAYLGMPGTRAAGTPVRQTAAILGGVLLLVPALFSIVKRGALSARPPSWFVAHVLASAAGLVLVSLHALGGQLLSPPGVVLGLLFFLVLQGTLARIFLPARLSQQFASRPPSFHQIGARDRSALADIIARKRVLLTRLDAQASEAVFSPNLRHALRHPWLTLRYARLAAAESRLVGARRAAGALLSLWRRVHIAVAVLFLAGLAAHVLVVTVFAGYAAGGRPIYWWHFAALGA